MQREPIKNHKDLKTYQMAFDAAMKIFNLSKKFLYLDVESGRELFAIHNQILNGLVNIITNPTPWLMKG